MTEEWVGVLPSVVTSAITTLVTLAIVAGLRALKTGLSRKKHPLLLRRDREQWSLRNRTRKVIPEASAWHGGGDGAFRIVEFYQDLIEPKVPIFVGRLQEGDVFVVQWLVRRRWGQDRQYSAQAHIRKDSYEFLMERELENIPVHN